MIKRLNSLVRVIVRLGSVQIVHLVATLNKVSVQIVHLVATLNKVSVQIVHLVATLNKVSVHIVHLVVTLNKVNSSTVKPRFTGPRYTVSPGLPGPFLFPRISGLCVSKCISRFDLPGLPIYRA